MYCRHCCQETKTTSPFVLLKLNENAYKILAVCIECKKTLAKFLPKNSIPYEFKMLDSRKTYLNYIPVQNNVSNKSEMILIENFLSI